MVHTRIEINIVYYVRYYLQNINLFLIFAEN